MGLAVGGISTFVGAAGALLARYRVCKPNQYLIRTGLGIKTMLVTRKGFQWPFQEAFFVDMNPRTFSFELHNMSKHKVEFKLPVVFTIGPKDPEVDLDAFKRYAQTMTDLGKDEIDKVVRGVIEGETRGLTANLSVEEMFSGKDRFRDEVVQKIQVDLSKMGLEIYNANIKEMSDYDANNKYFEYRKQRAIQTANYEAQIEVSEAKKVGEIGIKERERDTRVSLAKMDMDAKISENERNETIATSNAQLAEVEAKARKTKELANIQTDNEVNRQNELLLQEVERQRATRELEKLRADQLSKSQVSAEQKVVEADGDAKAIRTVAEANLYKQELEAKGTQAILEAHSAGLKALISSAQGDPGLAKFYLGLKDRLYQDIAAQQSAALQGLKPQISVWNMGGTTSSNPLETLTKGFQSLAPMVDGLQKHTGLNIPFWSSGNGVEKEQPAIQNPN